MYDLSRVPKTELVRLRGGSNNSLRADAASTDDRLAAEQATLQFAAASVERRQDELSEVEDTLSNGLAEQISGVRDEIQLAQQDRGKKFEILAGAEARIVPTGEATPDSLSAATVATSPQPTPTSGTQRNVTPYFVRPLDTGRQIVRSERALGARGVPSPNHLAAGPTAGGTGNAVINRSPTIQGRGGVRRYEAEAVGGQKLPSPYYLTDDIQYFAPGPEFTRSREATAKESKLDLNSLAKSHRENIANEQYTQIVENRFASVTDEPLSTFSIDVDTASYANSRRFLSQNQMPPANAIRIEEFINYFSYDYPAPKEGEPFSVNMEVAQCPWQEAHQLVRIGLKGKEVPQQLRPASNIVFLLDVSGSMQDANKLPLLKQAMKLLTDQLTESDRVSIATYAGNAGLALDTTNGESKQTIRDAIDALNANGSTNGSAGIQLAYEKATESFLKKGANRVILATDGDLNVGVTDDDALVELIKEKAASGVFLTVLGFGEGNLKDGKLEKLADNGNGMYAYIDSLREARKVLVEQISGSLVTIAKDVKIKVEFNPAERIG
jgi:uncharacterized protein YegL